MRCRSAALLLAAAGALAGPAAAQQVSDRDYRPAITAPAYATGAGPRACLDEGHHDFHTLDGRFWAFGELLRRDGYVVAPLRTAFEHEALASCAILVIANAQPSDAEWDTYPRPTPPAFTSAEVAAVATWVRGGGALLLIADHMPLAGAAASLAAAFDVQFTDGFAVERFDKAAERPAAMAKPTLFRTADGTLRDHAIVRGRTTAEAITQVRSFTGQAIRLPDGAEPLLVLPPSFVALMPDVAWQFTDDTRRLDVGGWSQGGVLRVGSGRAAFFGEAAMFSAQVAGPQRRPMGMNAPMAEQNFQFVLNVLHWLSGRL